jgi:hypothetical protein
MFIDDQLYIDKIKINKSAESSARGIISSYANEKNFNSSEYDLWKSKRFRASTGTFSKIIKDEKISKNKTDTD